jgi:hypothetical protein
LVFFYRGSDDDSDRLRRRLRSVTKRYERASGYAIDLDAYPAASGEFAIFRPPTIRIYIDGSIALQKAGNFEVREIEKILTHYDSLMAPNR